MSKSSTQDVRRTKRAADGGIAAATARPNGLTRAIRERYAALGATGASPVIKEVCIMCAQRKCIRVTRINSGGTAGVNKALVPMLIGARAFLLFSYHEEAFLCKANDGDGGFELTAHSSICEDGTVK